MTRQHIKKHIIKEKGKTFLADFENAIIQKIYAKLVLNMKKAHKGLRSYFYSKLYHIV